MALVQADVDNAVQAVATSGEAPAVTAARVQELRWFIQSCAARGVDLVGQGLEGLKVQGGQVWFHSPDGKPTGVPSLVQIAAALDVAAAVRLRAALQAKFGV